jgi:hypothetical protein
MILKSLGDFRESGVKPTLGQQLGTGRTRRAEQNKEL